MSFSDGLNATEKKLAMELAEAEFSTAVKVATNLVRSNHFNWQILHEARVPGLAEAVRRELAGTEDNETLLPQTDRVAMPIKTKLEMEV